MFFFSSLSGLCLHHTNPKGLTEGVFLKFWSGFHFGSLPGKAIINSFKHALQCVAEKSSGSCACVLTSNRNCFPEKPNANTTFLIRIQIKIFLWDRSDSVVIQGYGLFFTQRGKRRFLALRIVPGSFAPLFHYFVGWFWMAKNKSKVPEWNVSALNRSL